MVELPKMKAKVWRNLPHTHPFIFDIFIFRTKLGLPFSWRYAISLLKCSAFLLPIFSSLIKFKSNINFQDLSSGFDLIFVIIFTNHDTFCVWIKLCSVCWSNRLEQIFIYNHIKRVLYVLTIWRIIPIVWSRVKLSGFRQGKSFKYDDWIYRNISIRNI